MSTNSNDTKFISEARTLVLEELSNEQFGVSELADRMHMSRSNLLRKIKKDTGLSASQFIREVRLQEGMKLLKNTENTVSEISYQVGFNNNSYFTKCFREYYGFSPGEARQQQSQEPEDLDSEHNDPEHLSKPTQKTKKPVFVVGIVIVLILLVIVYKAFDWSSSQEPKNQIIEKSIAVLPFRNMSADSTNLYFVNGLMESSLNNLQKVEDLRVISRTSVEKYRNTDKTVPEIAEDLNVSYLVEGSGQRINDQVLLNIQLVDAVNDSPLWSEQYNYKIDNVFELQNTIAQKITEAIKAKVTPDELQRITKNPTDNLVAYDFYLKGIDKFKLETNEGLNEAITLFKQAVNEDQEFALAYANMAIAYFYLDLYKADKKYISELNNFADKALLYDSKSAESLMAKALYYINVNEYNFAIPHLEKALQYNPNSSAVIQFLCDIYSKVLPDTEKYLSYALKGIQLKSSSQDSISRSYTYLNLSNALIQNGFEDKALAYINLSLEYNPQNEYSSFLKVFIQHTKHENIKLTTRRLVKEWEKDTNRLDILQEVGKFYYMQANYDSAYYYYHKFDKARLANNLTYYIQEDLKIGIVYEKMGYQDRAKVLYQSFTEYCENDNSIYNSASLATKYAHEGDVEKAIEQLKIFSNQDNFQYWIVLFLEEDPLMKKLEGHTDFQPTIQKIKDRFWENHMEIKQILEKDELI